MLFFDFGKILFPLGVKIFRVSEFSSYEIELRNQVTQSDVTLRVTNSKIFNRNSSFELLTRLHKILI